MPPVSLVPRKRLVCVVRDSRSCSCICHRYCDCRCCSCCSLSTCRHLRSRALAQETPRQDLDAAAWVAAMAHEAAARRARIAAAAAAQAERAAAVAKEVASQARAAERQKYVQLLQSSPSKSSCTAMVKQRQRHLMRRAGLSPPPEPLVLERQLLVEDCSL